MTTVDVRGLRVTYRGAGRDVDALGGVDLRVGDGEPVAIIGPSGCGKSTLLLALAGLIGEGAGESGKRGAVVSGETLVDGRSVCGPRLRTALILQDFGLLPWKTVRHNAALGLEVRKVERPDRERRAMEALEQVGIAEFADAYPAELSGGMAQRLAVARALALDADLLLMDEPLSALDALTREGLQLLLVDLWKRRGYTSILVTHSIEEAVFLGRRIVVMSPRPGAVAAVVDNPHVGDPGYRNTEDFYAHCAELRALLKAEGAFVEEGRPMAAEQGREAGL